MIRDNRSALAAGLLMALALVLIACRATDSQARYTPQGAADGRITFLYLYTDN